MSRSKRFAILVLSLVSLAGVAAHATENAGAAPDLACVDAAFSSTAAPGAAPDLALALDRHLLPAPQRAGGGGFTYASCFCACRRERIACINACWSCTSQCYDQEFACQDRCIALHCTAPGSCMDPVTCS